MKRGRASDPTDPVQTRGEVTALLSELRRGREGSLDRLLPLVYGELRRIARRKLRGQPAGHTLLTTDLAHEAFLKLAGAEAKGWRDRRHFLAVAATAMRHILVDAARQRLAGKRGAGAHHVPLEDVQVGLQARALELLDLDTALDELARLDPRQARVVELHFFGGLTFDEAASVLEVSAPTAKRDWAKARAFLYRSLDERQAPP